MRLSIDELKILKDLIDKELDKYRVKDGSAMHCCTYYYCDRCADLFGLHYKILDSMERKYKKGH